MQLTVKLGTPVNAILEGHSSLNGAVIPDGSTITWSSNDASVAAIESNPQLPPGGAQSLTVPVTIFAKGSTDLAAHVVTPDGTPFDVVASLVVEAAPEPGLAFVTLTLVDATP